MGGTESKPAEIVEEAPGNDQDASVPGRRSDTVSISPGMCWEDDRTAAIDRPLEISSLLEKRPEQLRIDFSPFPGRGHLTISVRQHPLSQLGRHARDHWQMRSHLTRPVDERRIRHEPADPEGPQSEELREGAGDDRALHAGHGGRPERPLRYGALGERAVDFIDEEASLLIDRDCGDRAEPVLRGPPSARVMAVGHGDQCRVSGEGRLNPVGDELERVRRRSFDPSNRGPEAPRGLDQRFVAG